MAFLFSFFCNKVSLCISRLALNFGYACLGCCDYRCVPPYHYVCYFSQILWLHLEAACFTVFQFSLTFGHFFLPQVSPRCARAQVSPTLRALRCRAYFGLDLGQAGEWDDKICTLKVFVVLSIWGLFPTFNEVLTICPSAPKMSSTDDNFKKKKPTCQATIFMCWKNPRYPF
jgi:hypothetical protein